MTRLVSFIVLLCIILLCSILFYRVMASFFLPLFLAALLAVIFRPLHHWFLHRCAGRRHVAAGLTTGAVLLTVLIPLVMVSLVAFHEATELVTHGLNAKQIDRQIEKLRRWCQLDMPFREEVEGMDRGLAQVTEGLNTEPEDLARINLGLVDVEQEVQAIEKILAEELQTTSAALALVRFRDQLPELERKPSLRAKAIEQTEQLTSNAKVLAIVKAGQTPNATQLNHAILNVMRKNDRVSYESADEVTAGQLESRLERFEKVLVDLPKARSPTEADTNVQSLPSHPTKPQPDMTRTELWQSLVSLQEALESAPVSEDVLADLRLMPVHVAAFQQALKGGAIRSQLMDTANSSLTTTKWWRENSVALLSQGNLQQRLLSVTGATTARIVGILVAFAIMILSLYYFLAEGSSMINTIMRLSPLEDRYEEELIMEFDKVSRAVVLATLLSALAQGLLGGIGYGFAGLPSVFLLTLLTTVLALIPFVGAAAVWVPASLWLAFIEGRVVAGVMLAVYGAAIISMADNVIKPFVLHGQSKLHPLLALLSVLGGVQALGPIGILVGPMIVSFLQALLNILQKELVEMDGATTESS